MKAPKLIKNWREWPRMYSTWAFGAIASFNALARPYLGPEVMGAMLPFNPDWTWNSVANSATAFLAVTGFVGRLIAQDSVSDKPAEPEWPATNPTEPR